MCMFYQTVIESALVYIVVCWGSTTDTNCRRQDKKGQFCRRQIGRRLDPLSAVVEQRMKRKLYSVLENNKHPLYSILAGQRSSCSERLQDWEVQEVLFNMDCWQFISIYTRLIHRSGRGGAGAYPSGHRARGRVNPGQVTSPSQGHTVTNETNNHTHAHS